MALIYSMLTSLDGYTEDEHGNFGWGAPDSEEVHAYITGLSASVGTYLCGRKMYETMVYWETAHTLPNQPQFVLDYARQWQATEKIVYSRTLAEPRSARTRIEREFDPPRSGSSRPAPSTTSRLTGQNLPHRQSRPVLSMSSSRSSAPCLSAVVSAFSPMV